MIPHRASGLAVTLLAATFLPGCGSDGSTPQGTGGLPTATGGATTSSGGAGAGGLLISSGGNSGEGGSLAVCRGVAESCDSSLDCCDGMTCNNTAGALELNGCHPRCSQSADCQTGCCLLYQGANTGICADQKWCTCGATEATCGASNPACCDDHICLAADDPVTRYACKKRCQTNADCPTNCCVDLPNLATKACLAPAYCGVAP